MLVKLAGIDTTSYKLSDVKGSLDQKEMDKIFKRNKLTNHVYGKFLDGVLVIFCSVKVAYKELEVIVATMKQKAKDQKKKRLFKVTLFEYSH